MKILPDGLDLQPGDDPDAIAAAAIVIANRALNTDDHRELAGMIGVPVVPPQAREVSKASPEASPEASARRRPRCRKCGYLRSAPGHKRQCGGRP